MAAKRMKYWMRGEVLGERGGVSWLLERDDGKNVWVRNRRFNQLLRAGRIKDPPRDSPAYPAGEL